MKLNFKKLKELLIKSGMTGGFPENCWYEKGVLEKIWIRAIDIQIIQEHPWFQNFKNR
jgi:hypothetical protein